MRKTEELSNPHSCINMANDSEMVFVLLARDPAAQPAILAWIVARLAIGENTLSDQKLADAFECANIMEIQRKSGSWRLEKQVKGASIAIQNAEFEAVALLALQYERVTKTPVVDDDYPEVRRAYEGAIRAVIAALKANGRI